MIWVDANLENLYWGGSGKQAKISFLGKVETSSILDVKEGTGILKNPISKLLTKDY